MNERIKYVDTVKGFAIFLVVMGHVIAFLYFSNDNIINIRKSLSVLNFTLFDTIYAFHMPLFFFASGYVFPKTLKCLNDVWDTIFKRTYTLLLPYFIVGSIFTILFGGPGLFNKYWFLRTLFEFIIVNIIFDYIKQTKRLGWIWDISYYVGVFGLIHILHILFYNNHFYKIVDLDSFYFSYYLSFSFGILARRYSKVTNFLDKNYIYTVCLCLFFIITTNRACGNYFGIGHVSSYILYKFIQPFSGVICSWYLFKHVFNHGIITKAFDSLGKNSLEIYIIHFFFLFEIPYLAKYLIKLNASPFVKDNISAFVIQLISVVIASTIICLICLSVKNIISASKILSLIILGRK